MFTLATGPALGPTKQAGLGHYLSDMIGTNPGQNLAGVRMFDSATAKPYTPGFAGRHLPGVAAGWRAVKALDRNPVTHPLVYTAAAARNAAVTPFYAPLIREKHPHLAKSLGRLTNAALVGSTAAAAALAPWFVRDQSAQAYEDLLKTEGVPDHKAHEAATAFKEKFYSDYVPTLLPKQLGGEDTAFADAHRAAARTLARDVFIPFERDQLHQTMHNGPIAAPPEIRKEVGLALNVLRSTTPLGAATTAGLFAAGEPMDRAKMDAAVQAAGDQFAGRAPAIGQDFVRFPDRSRLAKFYVNTLPDRPLGDTPEERAAAAEKLRTAHAGGLDRASDWLTARGSQVLGPLRLGADVAPTADTAAYAASATNDALPYVKSYFNRTDPNWTSWLTGDVAEAARRQPVPPWSAALTNFQR